MRPAGCRFGLVFLQWALPLLIGVALVAAAGVSGASTPGPGSKSVPGATPRAFGDVAGIETEPADRLGPELPALRDRTSRTFVGPGGSRVTELSAGSLNYRRNGSWVPIDNRFVPAGAGGTVENAANRYSVRLPERMTDGPARVAVGDAWVDFELRGAGAGAERTVDGAVARYADVLPGVSAKYTTLPDSVKEELVLDGADSQSHFSFALRLADGMSARQRGQLVEFVDSRGDVPFVIAPPFAVDAAGWYGKVVQELRTTDTGYVLDVRVDREWLAAPGREFPVSVDPTFNFTWGASPDELVAVRDCTLEENPATAGPCSHPELYVGLAHGGVKHRPVLFFDVAGTVPKRAEILDADVRLFALLDSGTGGLDVDLHRLTAAFDNSATWTNRTASLPWATPGGDFASPRASWSVDVGWDEGEFYTWSVPEMVQGWVNGDTTNRGVLLKSAEQGADQEISFVASESSQAVKRPRLWITWAPRIGARRQWTFEGQQLWDRAGLEVNVANGNLLLSQPDLQLAGTGLDLEVTRFYNSQSEHWYDSGHGWSLNYGAAVGLQRFWDPTRGESAVFAGPSGFAARFERQPDGSFKSPSGLDATLVEHADDTRTLTFDKTQEKLHFDAQGFIDAREDRNGNTIDYEIDADGDLASITDTQGREVTFTHNATSQITSMEDSAGRMWTYDVSAGGLLWGYTDPDNQVTEYDYNVDLDLIKITDPNGNVTRLEYDAQNRVTEIVRVTDPVAGTGPTWTFTYNDGNTVVEDPRGNETTYHYDGSLRVRRVVDALGNERATTYSANSDPTTFTNEGPVQTTFGYDSLNNLESVDEPAGEESGFEYTNSGLPRFVTRATSPQGTTMAFGYDSFGNTTSVNDGASPAQVEARLEYNGQAGGTCPNDPTTKPGTLRCAVDGKGNETLYGYDDAGNLTSITPELPLGDTTITYDSLSRVRTVEDGKGQTRTISYDPLDRITEIEYSNGDSIAYDYDANGNLLERDDSVHGVSSYDYDKLNRRTRDTLPSGTTTYGWDAASNLTSLTDPGGTVHYRYDVANRLQDLAEPGGSCTAPTSLCTTFTYTDRDQRHTTTHPNGVTQTVDYDDSDKRTRIRAVKAGSPPTTLTDFTYTYHATTPTARDTYLRQSVTDKNGNKTTYGYDFLDRLTSAVERNSSNAIIDNRSWTYDAASNRKTQTVNGTTTSYGYNAANQLCWERSGNFTNACSSPPSGATTYTYDANGNTTASSAGLALAYNIKDHTTSFTPPGGSATSFAYAGPDQTERTAAGASAQHNTLIGLTREGTTSWFREPDGTLISRKAGSNRQYFLFDALGSVVGLANPSGVQSQTYKYDPYGVIRSSSGGVANPFQFAGEYRHVVGSAGLYKIGARYYHPALGRWTQLDPLDQAGSLRQGNRYVYAGSDPVNFTDPTGEALPAGVVAVGAAGVIRYGIARASASAAAQSARTTLSRVGARTTTGTLGRIRRTVEDNARDVAEFVGDLVS
jgi:RHS repeat-associated protein